MATTKVKAAEAAAETAASPAEADAVSLPREYFVVPGGGVRLRTAPSAEADVAAILPHGAGVWVEAAPEEGAAWIAVSTGILTGWIMVEFLAPVATDGAE